MDVLERMRELARRKAGLFCQYGQETRRLDTDDLEAVDDILEAIGARQALIERIDALDGEMISVRDCSPYGARCYRILRNQCDYGSIGEEEKELFREGQEIYAVMSGIREAEESASAKLEKVRQELQEKIRQNNKSGKFAGYLRHMDRGEKGILYDKRR